MRLALADRLLGERDKLAAVVVAAVMASPPA
jgi:hypothetical protein